MGILDSIQSWFDRNGQRGVNGLLKRDNPGSHGSHESSHNPGNPGGGGIFTGGPKVDFRVASMTGTPGDPVRVSAQAPPPRVITSEEASASMRAEKAAQEADVRTMAQARIAEAERRLREGPPPIYKGSG